MQTPRVIETDRASSVTQANVTPFQPSDFSFYAGAASIELVTILVILSTFYRFWKLGRRTSFSPLEIAQACLTHNTSSVPSMLS